MTIAVIYFICVLGVWALLEITNTSFGGGKDMEEIRQKTPEWEQVEDYPPRTGFIETTAMPGVLVCGVLMGFAAVADLLFFHYLPLGQDLYMFSGGIFGITVWAAAKFFLGRIVL